jgi:hypothetical protein
MGASMSIPRRLLRPFVVGLPSTGLLAIDSGLAWTDRTIPIVICDP